MSTGSPKPKVRFSSSADGVLNKLPSLSAPEPSPGGAEQPPEEQPLLVARGAMEGVSPMLLSNLSARVPARLGDDAISHAMIISQVRPRCWSDLSLTLALFLWTLVLSDAARAGLLTRRILLSSSPLRRAGRQEVGPPLLQRRGRPGSGARQLIPRRLTRRRALSRARTLRGRGTFPDSAPPAACGRLVDT